MNNDNKIGGRIGAFRERAGMTVEELAQNSGTSPEFVKAVEAGDTQPPIGKLMRLSRALGQRLGTFMDGVASRDPVISRLGPDDANSDVPGNYPQIYHFVPLAADKIDRHMEPFYIEMNPADADTPVSAHEGEEFMLVLDGEIEVTYGAGKHRVKKGETIYYNAVVPHLVAAAPGGNAKLFAMIYTPV